MRQGCGRRQIRGSREAGFSLIELALVMAGALTIAAIFAPSFSNYIEANRAAVAARTIEREMQTARLKAVSTSRSLRVRLDCPGPGRLRTLEVTGVASTDTASNRCDPVAFPFPGPRDTLRSTPSLDSPVVYLPEGTTIASAVQQFEFDPRGSVYAVDGSGVATILAGEVVLTVTRGAWSHQVRVNAIGRIRLE